MRKYIAILLAAVLALTLSVMASAAPQEGSEIFVIRGVQGVEEGLKNHKATILGIRMIDESISCFRQGLRKHV